MATFTGTSGNDTIVPGTISAAVTVSGTPGDLSANDFIYAGAGNDTVNGGALNDYVEGGDGADVISGGSGADRLYAGAAGAAGDGADTLSGGTGSDLMAQLGSGDRADGGDGDDLFDLDQVGVISLVGGLGTDTLQADGLDISAVTITGIENLATGATLKGSQLVTFTKVGTSTPFSAGGYAYVFTDTSTVADFTGRVADSRDSFTLDGVNGTGKGDRITFDATSTATSRIQGFDGNDQLRGGGGADTIYGGDGADLVSGGVGNDAVYGGYAFSANDLADQIYGGAGNDVLGEIGAGDTADGGDGDDFLVVQRAGPATLAGGTGTDTLQADGYDISAAAISSIENLWNGASLTGAQLAGFGKVGTSTFFSATSYSYVLTNTTTLADFTGKIADDRDTFYIDAVAGNADRITFDATSTAAARIRGLDGNDQLRGGAGNDDIQGGDGADLVSGGAGEDIVYAGYAFSAADGADLVYGGAGADVLRELGSGDTADGGDGDDYLDLDEAGAASLSGGFGVDTLQADGLDLTGTSVSQIENLANDARLTAAQLAGFARVGTSTPESAGNYTFYLTTAGTSILTGKLDDRDSFTFYGDGGGVQNDGILFDRASTATLTAYGYAGDDVIRGGANFDTLLGGIGDDVLEGGAGNDDLRGEDGKDTASYAGAAAGVTVSLAIAVAQDTLGAGIDTLTTIERLLGSSFSDTLRGNTGSNLIDGGAGGNDTLNGDLGYDTVSYASATAGVTVDLAINAVAQNTVGAGSDYIRNFERLDGSNFADTLFGTTLTDTLAGSNGNDTLYGRAGNDVLYGDAGVDRLEGSTGNDQLYGGSENDTLVGGAGDDRLQGDGGFDVFVFTAGGNSDKVADFSNGVDRLSFAGFGANFDTATEIRNTAAQIGTSVQITIPNPGGAGTTVVTLSNFTLANLDSSDFIVVA